MISHLKNIFALASGVIVVGSIFFSCSDDEDKFQSDESQHLSVTVTLPGTVFGETRANLEQKDGWSVVSFEKGDEVGLYSSAGNMKTNDGNGPFINASMSFSRSVTTSSSGSESGYVTNYQFDNPDLEMDRSKFKYNETTLYFPYCEDMTDKGLPLRRKKDNTGVDRCVDFLLMDHLNSSKLTNEQQLSGSFNHVFSELIIVRGEGFENADNKDITIVLSQGYSHVRLVDNKTNFNKDAWKIPELFYDPSCGMTEAECRKWQAWQAAKFQPSFDGAQEKMHGM